MKKIDSIGHHDVDEECFSPGATFPDRVDRLRLRLGGPRTHDCAMRPQNPRLPAKLVGGDWHEVGREVAGSLLGRLLLRVPAEVRPLRQPRAPRRPLHRLLQDQVRI